MLFRVKLYEKKDGCYGTLSIRHQPTDGLIEFPIGDAPTKKEFVEKAMNILKCIQSDLEHTIEIMQKHIDTNCEHIPYYSKGKYYHHKPESKNNG